MLQKLRQTSKSWVGIILAFFLILLFAVWGVQDLVSVGVGPGDTVIEVGDTSVSSRDIESTFLRTIQTRERQQQRTIDFATAQREGIVDGIIDATVEQSLFDQAARDAELMVADPVVVADIRSNPMFHVSDGQFDQVRFRQLLAQINLSERGYIQLRKGEIAREYILATLGNVMVPANSYLDMLYRHRNESRVVQVATIPYQSVSELPEPEPSQLQEIYQANQEPFTAPEYRTVSLMVLTTDEVAAGIELDDGAVRQAYDSRRDEFREPEKRLVDHILFRDEETARHAEAALESGEDYEQVAREMGDGAPIDLGEVERNSIPIPDIRDAAFDMSEPGVSGIVRSPFGWHIVRVAGIRPEQVRPFEEVREELARDLRERRARREMDEIRIRIEDMLDEGKTLEEIAGAVGDDVRKIERIDAEGRNPQGGQVEGLPEDPELMRLIFEFGRGETSDVHEAGNNVLYVMRVDDIQESHLRPLDEVRDQVRALWDQQQRERIAAERARSLFQRVEGGTSIEDAAREINAELRTSRPLTRGRPSSPQGAGSSLQAKAFSSRQGEPFVATVEGGVAVGVVREIRTVEADRGDDAYGTMIESYNRNVAGEMIAQFSAGLREQYDVVIRRDEINEALSRNR